MTTFTFYQAGLALGQFHQGPTGIEYTWFDQPDWQLLSPQRNQELIHYGRIDIAKTIARFNQGEFKLPETGTHFTTSTGAKYEQRNDHEWVNHEEHFALNLICHDHQVVGFQSSTPNLSAVLIQAEFAADSVVGLWQQAGYSQTPGPMAEPFVTNVPMRDGTQLSTMVLLPDGPGPFNTIMERTPYGKEIYADNYYHHVMRGDAVVLQDVRGRGDSTGEWIPFIHEEFDGSDTLDWIAQQPWSTGKIGMDGGSYDGFVQWAAAASGNPHLTAMCSMMTAGGPFTDTFYHQGAPSVGMIGWSIATDKPHFDPSLTDRDDWDDLYQIRPLWKIPVVALGHESPGLSAYMKHDHYDDFLAQADWFAKRDHITTPVLIQSGWYDDDGVGTTEAIAATNDYAPGQRHIILGPWLHGGNTQYDLGPAHFGPEALCADIDLRHQQWFDHFLAGADNGVNAGPAVEYYTVGDEQWHQADQFPPAGNQHQLHLTATGDLTPTSPEAGQRQYCHDPANPVPKLISVTQNEFEYPADYQQVEKRADVLSFTTETLSEPLRLCGQVTVDLLASSSAVDCDWDARVLDVFPDGQSVQIVEGIMNAKFRHSDATPELLTPDKPEHFTFKTQKTSYALQPGHALRLDIQSSAAGFVFPNGGTAEGFNTSDTVKATQTIFCGPDASTISFISDDHPISVQ